MTRSSAEEVDMETEVERTTRFPEVGRTLPRELSFPEILVGRGPV